VGIIVSNLSGFGKRSDSRVTLSSSTNALSFSAACTTKRFRRDVRQQQSTIKINLKQSEEFEDNHDNENHSNYVQEGSAHAGRLC
jgi:hypothetical protein